MKLRNKKSVITSNFEGRPKKRTLPSISKTIYFLIIILMLFYGGKYLLKAIIFISGKGIVVTETFLLSSGEYAVINNIFKIPNQPVKKGESLVKLNYIQKKDLKYELEYIKVKEQISQKKAELNHTKSFRDSINKSINNNSKNLITTPFTLKKLSIENEYETLKNKIKREESNLKIEKEENKGFIHLKILEAKNSDQLASKNIKLMEDELIFLKSNLKNISIEHNKINEFEIQYLKDLLKAQNDKIMQLSLNIKSLEKTFENIGFIKNGNMTTTLVSPVKGKVSQVFKLRGETVNKDNSIIELIEEDPQIEIRALFRLKDLDKIQTGKKVRIVFPDKKSSKGIIDKIYSNHNINTPVPLSINSSLENYITVSVLPLNKEEKNIWKKYNKLNVQVRFLNK